MGTRSITKFINPTEKNSIESLPKTTKGFTAIYRQYDGYYSEHGKAIKEYLLKYGMSNGIAGKCFNGMSDAALRLFCHLKTYEGTEDHDQAGGFYMEDPSLSPKKTCQDYEYHLTILGYWKGKSVWYIRVYSFGSLVQNWIPLNELNVNED